MYKGRSKKRWRETVTVDLQDKEIGRWKAKVPKRYNKCALCQNKYFKVDTIIVIM